MVLINYRLRKRILRKWHFVQELENSRNTPGCYSDSAILQLPPCRSWIRHSVISNSSLFSFTFSLMMSSSLVLHSKKHWGDWTMFQPDCQISIWKCQLFQTKIRYLRHVVTSKGTSTDGEKICAIQEWPQPQTEMDLRGLLRLAGYYIIFVQDYAKWPHLDTANYRSQKRAKQMGGSAVGIPCHRNSKNVGLKHLKTPFAPSNKANFALYPRLPAFQPPFHSGDERHFSQPWSCTGAGKRKEEDGHCLHQQESQA